MAKVGCLISPFFKKNCIIRYGPRGYSLSAPRNEGYGKRVFPEPAALPFPPVYMHAVQVLHCLAIHTETAQSIFKIMYGYCFVLVLPLIINHI